jgi:transcriptional regulator with XRE-family HTH domain
MTTAIAAPPVGRLLKEWRGRRRMSQLDLAVDAGVSTRHLSFVETGRAKPSRELLLLLADRLEVPLRERNAFLLAAGYAPRYQRRSLDDETMSRVQATLQQLLDRHAPYPGVVIDRMWNVVLANDAASRLVATLPAELIGPPMNVFRACLHPDGLAAVTLNFHEWASYLVGQLHRLAVVTGDENVQQLRDEVDAYPNVATLDRRAPADEVPELWIPWRVGLGGAELAFFTTLTTFGTPQDVTLSELAVELFYPADDRTEELLRAMEPSARADTSRR